MQARKKENQVGAKVAEKLSKEKGNRKKTEQLQEVAASKPANRIVNNYRSGKGKRKKNLAEENERHMFPAIYSAFSAHSAFSRKCRVGKV